MEAVKKAAAEKARGKLVVLLRLSTQGMPSPEELRAISTHGSLLLSVSHRFGEGDWSDRELFEAAAAAYGRYRQHAEAWADEEVEEEADEEPRQRASNLDEHFRKTTTAELTDEERAEFLHAVSGRLVHKVPDWEDTDPSSYWRDA